MFTGIIQGKGTLLGRMKTGGGLAFELEADFDLSDPEEGESIAVSGVCLTANRITGNRFTADVSPETLSKTKLGELVVGNTVNLERALRLSDRLGGHLVSGHVDCVGRLTGIRAEGSFTVLNFSVPDKQDKYIIEKGSIAVDGISLTVNTCEKGRFSVSVIPHTMQVTTLAHMREGSRVNIEVDIVGKYIEKLLAGTVTTSKESVINAAYLAEKGFF